MDLRRFAVFVFACHIAVVLGYHDLDKRYECWETREIDEDYDEEGIKNIIECPAGLSLEWIKEPPNEVEVGESFEASYRIVYDNDLYRHYEHKLFNMSSEAHFREFCENMTCTAETVDGCCVRHSNIHICSPQVDFCGPWIPNDGKISTHTSSQFGLINQDWTSSTRVNHLGNNVIIAHVRLRYVQIALGKDILAKSKENNLGVILPSVIIPLVIVPLVVVLIVVMSAYGWYYYQRQKLLYDESWIVNYEDIERDVGFRGFMGSLVSVGQWMESDAGGLSQGDGYISNVQRKQIFTQTGLYKGRPVAIKKLENSSFSLTHTVREEVRRIREMDHPNLCKFIGASIEVPTLAIITEYCPKGSLNDVLQNDDIPLQWAFRYSFATDIAKGMAFLHSRKLPHGKLKSSNCIIDDRWVVKLTDYGLVSFVSNSRKLSNTSSVTKVIDAQPSGNLLYLAPERKGDFDSLVTQAADVYSFAILLVEIGSRMDPNSDDVDVDGSGRPRLPNFREMECPTPVEYLELISRCWAHSPSSRPSFDQIRRSIVNMNPNKESPVDMMMAMMEKYSKHLEVLVAERTQELIAEQKKTDELLHSMIPKAVADDLRHGKVANAQFYQCATIFFSDIVGFTELASNSTPLQIVKLLNELYTMFDTILDTYDVYKVETIGDAYMVVSGVPKENGINHASEVANMALDLISAAHKFKIHHKPTQILEVRAGIHSGPVVAGVVGTKMPRYCLFGDTVNTASRMESASEAMKIQVSDSTAQLLKKNGTFQMDCRGTIQVKGKGPMITWWLVGRDSAHRCQSNGGRRESRFSITIPPKVVSRPGTSNNRPASSKHTMQHRNTVLSLPGSTDA